MRLFKILSLASFLLVLVSCNKDVDTTVFYSKYTALTPAQVVPAQAGAGTGSMEYTYTPVTKSLVYTIRWNGITGAPTAINIRGTATEGFSSGTIIQSITGAASTSGSYSGTLLVDGIVVKEADLLGGKYYVNISTAASTTLGVQGEIRGQIKF